MVAHPWRAAARHDPGDHPVAAVAHPAVAVLPSRPEAAAGPLSVEVGRPLVVVGRARRAHLVVEVRLGQVVARHAVVVAHCKHTHMPC